MALPSRYRSIPPRPELEYFIDDTEASTLVFDALAAPLLSPIAAARGIRALSYEQLLARVTQNSGIAGASPASGAP